MNIAIGIAAPGLADKGAVQLRQGATRAAEELGMFGYGLRAHRRHAHAREHRHIVRLGYRVARARGFVIVTMRGDAAGAQSLRVRAPGGVAGAYRARLARGLGVKVTDLKRAEALL